MKLAGATTVVTGAASGIGRALARRFAAEGARAVVVVDRDADGIAAVAAEIGARAGGGGAGATSVAALQADVGVQRDIERVVDETEARFGPIDLFCSNAGILVLGGAECPDDEWQRIWQVNVMAHVYAARVLVPRMLARGGGYLLNTASAAGLLSQIGSAPYAVTKHAAVAFAEWLSITHGGDGLKVSVLCPQAVRTPMATGVEGAEDGGVAAVDGMIEPDDVAQCVAAGLADERFLILPHPTVAEYFRRKSSDYDRWLRGMRRLQQQFGAVMRR